MSQIFFSVLPGGPRQAGRETETGKLRHTDIQKANRHTNRGRQTERQTDRLTGRQRERETD